MIEYKNISLSSQVYDKIEEEILNGSFKAGETISEKKICQALGVSRTPVREAMARLSHENLIKDTQNGTIVVGVTKDDLRDLFEIKRTVEVIATGRTAENISQDGIKKLEEILEQQEFYAHKGNSEMVRDLDTSFHDLIYKESGSSVFQGILSPIHHKMRKYRKVSLEQENRIFESVKEHEAIFNAITEHDSEKVQKLMLAHIQQAYINMIGGEK